VLIGIDLGGTNIKFGLVADDGRLVKSESRPTLVEKGPEDIISRMAETARRLIEGSSEKVAAIGVGSPGPLDSRTGVVTYTPNLKWKNVPLGGMMREKLGMDAVYVENDANAAAWGEFWAGAGRGAASMVMITLGTGVGGGVIIDGKLLRGIDETAGHIGHIVIDSEGPMCGCGNRGCLEAYASATALVRRALEALRAKRSGALAGLSEKDLSAKRIAQEAARGDALARNLVEETGRYLGVALADVANVLNPELAVIGGGLAGAGELLLGPAREEMRARALKPPAQRLKIVPAGLGDNSGVIGAAGCAKIRSEISR